MAWPKWLVDNGGGEKPTEVAKPIKDILPQPNNSYGPQFGQVVSPMSFSAQGMDQPQHEKWSKTFVDLLASKGDPKYRQFIAMTDGMLGIPDNVRYPSVFNGLRTMGLTKASLLDAAQRTIEVLNKDAEEFTAIMEKRYKERVADPGQMVLQKQAEIQKLQQEIADLTTSIGVEDSKINMSKLGYSTYFKQAQTKVGNDVASITNFIQE